MAFSRGPRTILVALATVAANVAVAFPPSVAARPSALAPSALFRARTIRAEVNARYRLMPRRKLVVTEATTTGVVDSLTLLDPSQAQLWRVVPAENGRDTKAWDLPDDPPAHLRRA